MGNDPKCNKRRVWGFETNKRCSKLSASNLIETKETIIIKYYMQILQILIERMSEVLSRILKSCHSNALVSQRKFTTLIQIGNAMVSRNNFIR